MEGRLKPVEMEGGKALVGDVRSIPDICHGHHGRRPCNFFLAGVNFFRFNAKNWQFTDSNTV